MASVHMNWHLASGCDRYMLLPSARSSSLIWWVSNLMGVSTRLIGRWTSKEKLLSLLQKVTGRNAHCWPITTHFCQARMKRRRSKQCMSFFLPSPRIPATHHGSSFCISSSKLDQVDEITGRVCHGRTPRLCCRLRWSAAQLGVKPTSCRRPAPRPWWGWHHPARLSPHLGSWVPRMRHTS